MLTATATIPVANARFVLERLCTHFAEHGDVEFGAGEGRIVTIFGSARIVAGDGALTVLAEASDLVNLAYVKLGIAEHVAEMTDGAALSFAWRGDGANMVVPPFFRVMRVEASYRLAPRMQRIVLSGADLERYAKGGLHIRLVFPPKDRPAVWPTLGADGRVVWPEGKDALVHRIYTIRRIDLDAGTVDIDIVLHPGSDTPGSSFAENAVPGDLVGMMGPGGDSIPESPSLVLFGDETAMPAIARILEHLPAETKAKAFIEVDAAETAAGFDGPQDGRVTFLDRGGAAPGSTNLLFEAVRNVDWPDEGDDVYAWAGCEFSAFRDIRRFLRGELKMPRERHLAVAYWRRGDAGDAARTASDPA